MTPKRMREIAVLLLEEARDLEGTVEWGRHRGTAAELVDVLVAKTEKLRQAARELQEHSFGQRLGGGTES